MYEILLSLHSWFRWLVMISLLACIARSYCGWALGLPYKKSDYFLRSFTASIGHLQLLIGLALYFKSPLVAYFNAHFREAIQNIDVSFFGIYHVTMMMAAILVQTIGSSLSKRKKTDREKFKTAAVFFTISLVLICLAIPWQGLPYASRPLFRPF